MCQRQRKPGSFKFYYDQIMNVMKMGYSIQHGEDSSTRGVFGHPRNICAGCGESGTIMYVLRRKRYHDGCGPIVKNPFSSVVSYDSELVNGLQNSVKRLLQIHSYPESPEPTEKQRLLSMISGAELRLVVRNRKKR